MSPEMETLDQLLGGELRLTVILSLYQDQTSFLQGLFGLLSSGDVSLQTTDKLDVPEHRWNQLIRDGTLLNELERFQLRITPQGARRIS